MKDYVVIYIDNDWKEHCIITTGNSEIEAWEKCLSKYEILKDENIISSMSMIEDFIR